MEKSVEALIADLANTDRQTRLDACKLLGERRSRSGALQAMALLSDPEFAVRFAAGLAIGKTFNYWFHAVAVCVAMLKDGDERNRRTGKESLLSLGDHARADIDLLTMALDEVPLEARLDIEDLIHRLMGM
jgi:HEAT repeat protein